MKYFITLLLLLATVYTKAQKVDSIYVNLYTDSLKKGSFNYINVDGLLSNGHYLPMDSNHVSFAATDGKFYGNSLWLEPEFNKACVDISVCLKSDPAQVHKFRLYVKTKPDDEHLKTNEEIIADLKKARKKKN